MRAQANFEKKENSKGKWKDTGTWQNEGGNVTNTPGSSDRAIINSGELQISGDEFVGELRLGGGDLTGYDESQDNETVISDSLTLTGGSADSQWTGGTISDLTLIIGESAIWDIDNASNTMSGATLDVRGTVNWNSGPLLLQEFSFLDISGDFNDFASSQIKTTIGTAGSITIQSSGAYTKLVSGTTEFDLALYNYGALQIDAGALVIDGGGTHYDSESASMEAASGTIVVFHSNFTVENAATLFGSGQYEIEAGLLDFNGLFSGTDFEIEGGSLTGTHTFANGATWTGGQLQDGATTNASGSTFNFSVASGNSLTNHTFANEGTVNWTDGNLYLQSGSTVTNSGTFNDTDADDHEADTTLSTEGSFTNTSDGTYHKTGAGQTTFKVVFDSNGQVSIDDGTLKLAGTGTIGSSSRLTAAAGATIIFASDYTVTDAVSLKGDGQFELSAGTLTLDDGSCTVHASDFKITGGTLTGSQTFSEGATWTGGQLKNGTTFNAESSVFNWSSSSGNSLTDHSFTNYGTVNWTTGNLYLQSGSSVTNQGTLTDTSASDHIIDTTIGSEGSFTNNDGGTYRKTGDSTTGMKVAFHNNGEVFVDAGTLVLDGTGTTTGTSLITAAAGAEVKFDSDFTVDNASSLQGDGQFTLSDGTLTLNESESSVGVSDFQITGGTLTGTQTFTAGATWTGGQLANGTTTNASGSSFNFSSASGNTLTNHTFTNQGRVSWTDGNLYLQSGSSLNNNGAFNDTDADDHRIDTSIGSQGSFSNGYEATYTKSGAGRTDIDVSFNSDGTVSVEAGTLAFNGGGSFSSMAELDVATDATANFTSNFSITDASALQGTGQFLLSQGLLDLHGEVGVSGFTISGGALSGYQTFYHGATWTGGQLQNGSTTNAATSTFAWAGPSNLSFSGHAFSNAGTVNWSDGSVYLQSGSAITNSGDFNDSDADDHFLDTTISTEGSFTNTNTGTYTKSGAGETEVKVTFDNAGEVQVDAGTLVLAASGEGSSGGTFQIAEGATLEFSQSYSLADLDALTGAGDFLVSGGTLAATTGDLVGNLTLDGGNLEGLETISGTLTQISGSLGSGHDLTVTEGGQWNLRSKSALGLFGDDLLIQSGGTFEWSSGNVSLASGSLVTNHGDVLLNAPGGLTLSRTGTLETLTNTGTITQSADSGTTTFAVPVINTGTVKVEGGSLVLAADTSIADTSTIQVGSATEAPVLLLAPLNFVASEETESQPEIRITDGTTTVEDAAVFSGDGALVVAGGTLDIDGHLDLDLFLHSGDLQANALTLYRGLEITGGSLASGTNLFLASDASALLDTLGLDLTNTEINVASGATLEWAAGDIAGLSSTAGIIVNGGLMTATGDNTFTNDSGGGYLVFTNNGQFRKTGGTGTTTLDAYLSLTDSRFEVHTGAVTLNAGGGFNNALFDTWADTSLNFDNAAGLYLFSGQASTFQNGGNVNFLNGTFAFTNNAVNVGQHATLSGGTFSANTGFNLSGQLTWTGGSLDLNSPVIAEDGALVIDRKADTTLTTNYTVEGRLTWASGDLTHTKTLTIADGGTFEAATDGSLTAPSIVNHGDFVKTDGDGTTTVNAPFDNYGNVLAAAGTLEFADTFTFSGGQIGVANGGLITFTAPLTLPTTAVLAGNGTIQADITTGGTVSPGASVGAVTVDGDLTLLSSSNSFFEIDVVDSVLAFDKLTVTGTLTLAGNLEIDFLTSVDPISTDMFTLYTAATLTGTFANVANGGLVSTDFNGGTGTFTVNYGSSSLFDPNSVVLTNFEFTPVPEPSTWALMITGLGLIGVQLYRRRRRA